MPLAIPIYFDYASSLCYVAWQIMRRLEGDLDVVGCWRPVHIAARHPQWQPGHSLPEAARANVERVAREAGVAVRIPAQWLDSRAALEGALFAEEQGRAAAYHAAVFQAAFAAGDDISERSVLVRAAAAAGLPLGSFMECIATRRMAPALGAVAHEARRCGVAGFPTFLLGGFPLTGVQAYDTMKLLIDRHLRRHRAALHS